MDYTRALGNFQKKADTLNRPDLLCLSFRKIGTSDMGHIYSAHYNYVETLPSRVQIQAALNRDFGSTCVIDPTSVLGGTFGITAKVYSKYPQEEFDRPKSFIANLSRILQEKPNAKYVEIGDFVRFFNASVVEGQVVGFQGPNFTVRVGADFHNVAGDDIVDVKRSPKFFPVDKEAEKYYLELYPADFVKKLVDNNPADFIKPDRK